MFVPWATRLKTASSSSKPKSQVSSVACSLALGAYVTGVLGCVPAWCNAVDAMSLLWSGAKRDGKVHDEKAENDVGWRRKGRVWKVEGGERAEVEE